LKHFFIFYIFICILYPLSAQEVDKEYFRSPLNIPLYLSGNFAELRSNHFHSGLDIKTQGVEGFDILSSAEGFVSRVRISHYGYGNVVYIDHPNGYTTVYAHLQSFNDEINDFVKNAQYDIESYEVDLYPSPDQLPLSKGTVIGKSGNSGSSGGPHLHFEIRETKTEFPVNPLLFGFDIQDNVKPSISEIMIIPLSDSASVENSFRKLKYPTQNSYGKCKLKKKEPIKVYGEVGFAINTIDKLNGYPNKCGIFTIQLFVDSQLIYGQEMSKIDFEKKRYINAQVVFDINKQERKNFQRSYLLPNNTLDIYNCVENSGKVNFSDGQLHDVKYIVTDTYGNTSTLEFQIQSLNTAIERPQVSELAVGAKDFHYENVNWFTTDDCELYLPEDALFDDIDFEYKKKSRISDALSERHSFSNELIPLNKKALVRIKNDVVADSLNSKLLIVKYNPKNKKRYARGGSYDEGLVSAHVRDFGEYLVMIDTIAPRISNVNFANSMQGRNSFSFKISDELSGIKHYSMHIDDKWVLGEYVPKRNRITYRFDKERLKKGEHVFKLVVVDERGNRSEFEGDFTW